MGDGQASGAEEEEEAKGGTGVTVGSTLRSRMVMKDREMRIRNVEKSIFAMATGVDTLGKLGKSSTLDQQPGHGEVKKQKNKDMMKMGFE